MFKKADWRVFTRLLAYTKPYKGLTSLALIFLLGKTVVESFIPLVASYFIDHFIQHIDQLGAMILVAYYGLYLIQALLDYFGKLFFARVSFSVIKDIRQNAFATMEQQSMRYFDQTPSGTIVSRLTNDTETISEMFSDILASFISAFFIFVATFYTMWQLNASLTALVALCLPVIFILVGTYRRLSSRVVEETRRLLAEINAKLSESIVGIRVIQAFNQEERLSEEFAQINGEHVIYANKSMALDSLFLRPAMSLLKLLAYALLMVYFGLNWKEFGISAGVMYAFIQYVNRLFDPLIQVTQNFSTLQTSIVSAKRVFDAMDQVSDAPRQGDLYTPITKGDIRFDKVSFSYDGEHQILKEISFSVKSGQTIAFVGPTGSGKSSIINVLMRFYEFQSGHILVDGRDIREYSEDALRQAFGLVLQEPFLYHGTIASNIAMYQELTASEIEDAAKFVDADSFIRQLPYGYQQAVSERGTSFSMGQRQLLTFARTIARKPKVLIL